jgi:condensin complex subunit 3
MTDERGGGDTVIESTELIDSATTNVRSPLSRKVEEEDDAEGEEEEEEADDEDDPTLQLQREMRDTTLGFTTGLPDAEGTKIHLLGEDDDTEMMDVDE